MHIQNRHLGLGRGKGLGAQVRDGKWNNVTGEKWCRAERGNDENGTHLR